MDRASSRGAKGALADDRAFVADTRLISPMHRIRECHVYVNFLGFAPPPTAGYSKRCCIAKRADSPIGSAISRSASRSMAAPSARFAKSHSQHLRRQRTSEHRFPQMTRVPGNATHSSIRHRALRMRIAKHLHVLQLLECERRRSPWRGVSAVPKGRPCQ